MADYAVEGMISPHTLRLTITPTTGQSFDMTKVAQVTLGVNAPDRITLWDTVIVSQTTTELVVDRLFADGDLPFAGEYLLVPNLFTPIGYVQCSPVRMVVYE